MFWQNYVRLCNKVGKAPSVVAVEIGKTDAVATGWKKGAIPRQSTLLQLAEYFGVTVDYLLSDNEKPTPGVEDGLTPDQRELIDLLPQLSPQMIAVLSTVAKALLQSQDSL